MTENIEFKVPVLFLIFNRPDMTWQVFQEIRKIKPSKFYVAADGPRENFPEDIQKCSQAREIIKQVDWDCEVKTLFRNENLGCKMAVSQGIDWLFTHEESGIILEDDTLADQSFFRYCRELLEYYKDNSRVMMISGDNFQFGKLRTEYSYYFSRYTHVWGWATWRRAWKHYDLEMKIWPQACKNKLLASILDNRRQVAYWSGIFNKVFAHKINAWSYSWLFACWLQNGLTILPRVNLVSSIGFGSNSTHTKNKSILANLKREQLVFPLAHPPGLSRDVLADKFTEKYQYSYPRIYKKIANLIYGR